MSAPLGLTFLAKSMAPSATLAMNETVSKRRAEGHATIHLGFGEASFPLHPTLRVALQNAAKRKEYAPVLGLQQLRVAIAGHINRTRDVQCSPEQIVVGPGSKPLIYALLQVLEGDLLLPVPSWVSYSPQAMLAGRRVINVITDPSDRHRLTPKALSEALADARARGANPRILLVNSPSNPTGSMFDRDDVEAVALWSRDSGITLISDEIYAELSHGWRKHVSPACYYPSGCIITGGLSKAFSAGGWRLGFAVIPSNEEGTRVVSALRAIASEIWSAAATPIQEAAISAFTQNAELESYVRRSARIHGHCAARLHETLVSLGVPCPRPAGAFYLYPDFSPWRSALLQRGVSTSDELSRYMLDTWDISALPGTSFGEQPSVLCVRFATSMLCFPKDGCSEQDREVELWKMLEQADEVSPTGSAGDGIKLTLPSLECAQIRITELVQTLSRDGKD